MPNIPKFEDATRPPPGGWSYFYNPSNRATMFTRFSPAAVFEEIEKYDRNNGKLRSREAIEEEVWRYWCSYDPVRCGQVAPSGQPVPMIPADTDKNFWGPIIWRFLNLAAVRYDFIGRDAFLTIVQSVHPMMSCPLCREHWLELIAADSPLTVSDAKSASEWVWRIHNRVNLANGKAEYPYKRGVTEYGFPL